MSGILEVPSLINGVASLVNTVVTRIFPDPADQAKAALAISEMQQTGELARLAADTDLAKAQITVNNTEASSSSWIASNWRPLIGIACVGAFVMQFILGPWLTWISALCGNPVIFPQLDVGNFMPVLLGMLGLGGLRTYEKKLGVAN